jgi:hypothetical protein
MILDSFIVLSLWWGWFMFESGVPVGTTIQDSQDAAVTINSVKLVFEFLKKVNAMGSPFGHKGDLHIRSLKAIVIQQNINE